MAEIEIDLGKEKIKVDEGVGKLIIAHRDAEKAAHRALSDELAKAKQSQEAEAAKAEKALKDKEISEATKAGDIEKLKAMLTKEKSETVDKLATKYRDTHLEALVSRTPNLLKLADADKQKALVADLVTQLRSSCEFDINTDMLVVKGQDGRPALGSDGKPKTADAFVSEFLEARPYLRQPTQSQGSGGAGSGPTDTSAKTMTNEEYDQAIKDPARAQQVAKQIAERKLRVV